MKFLKVALLGSALSLSALAAQATTFDFSYTFDPNNTGNGLPVTISGSFDGTEIGNLISNISNAVVSINGNAFSGPIMVEAADASGNWSSTVAPVISTDVGQTNFIFADADVANNPAGVSNYFYITTGQAGGVNFNVTDAGGNPLSGFETASNASWTVTAAAAVPEPSTYAMLAAGLGLIGLVSLRRRQS